jgi:hypothetical protein
MGGEGHGIGLHCVRERGGSSHILIGSEIIVWVPRAGLHFVVMSGLAHYAYHEPCRGVPPRVGGFTW